MKQIISTANNFMMSGIIAEYLPVSYYRNIWEKNGAQIQARPVQRIGLPEGAQCWRYVIESAPEEGWCISVRASWDRFGRLLTPYATHVAIDDYQAQEGFFFFDMNSMVLRVNEWLRRP